MSSASILLSNVRGNLPLIVDMLAMDDGLFMFFESFLRCDGRAGASPHDHAPIHIHSAIQPAMGCSNIDEY